MEVDFREEDEDWFPKDMEEFISFCDDENEEELVGGEVFDNIPLFDEDESDELPEIT